MKKIIRWTTAVMLAVIMVVMQMNTYVVAEKKTAKVGKGMYTIIDSKKKEVRFDGISGKSPTTLTIPATVKINKKTYKVTVIKQRALKGNLKIKKLTIGKNVRTIGVKAFYGCKNLKNITIKTTKLIERTVGRQAFGNLSGDVKFKMPESKSKAYNKILQAKGLSDGKQPTESKEENETPRVVIPDVIPDPETEFYNEETEYVGIDPVTKNELTVTNKLTDAEYKTDENIVFFMRARPSKDMYGYWTISKKKVEKIAYSVGWDEQMRWFDNYDDFCKNDTFGNGMKFFNYMIYKHHQGQIIDAWHWNPDDTLCSGVFRFTLPTGLTYEPDSIIVKTDISHDQLNPTDGGYTIATSGQDIIISVNDMKSKAYWSKSGRAPSYVMVWFKVKLNETAADISQVNASLTYSYKDINKTIDMAPVTIRKKADEATK